MENNIQNIKEKAKTLENKSIIDNKIQLRDLGAYFIIYSFLGWLMETIYMSLLNGHFTNRGFLFGPICPIYGYGITILILLASKYKDNIIKLFFSSFFVLSIFEYIVSFGLEALFKEHWWEYESYLLSLNGRICLVHSILWGILSIIFFKLIHPIVTKLINKLSNKIQYPIVTLLILAYIVDNSLSIVFAFLGKMKGIV